MRRDLSAGFTLLEINLAMVIVGMIAVTLGTFYSTAGTATRKYLDITRAHYLAAGMIEEIHARRWDENTDTNISAALGVESGEIASNKSTLDDFDDFNGYAEAGILYPDGAALSGYDGFSRDVTVGFVDSLNAASALPTTRKKVTVKVSKGGKVVTQIGQVFAQGAAG